MTLLFIGLICGLIVGGSLGMLVFALMFAAKQADNMMGEGKQYEEN